MRKGQRKWEWVENEPKVGHWIVAFPEVHLSFKNKGDRDQKAEHFLKEYKNLVCSMDCLKKKKLKDKNYFK